MSLLLEVGLGGRLDSTNVVEAPLASVITPVSMDHMEFLGDTLTSIAGEKAAIIKRGVPVISRRAGGRGDGRDRAAGAGACARRCMPPASNGMSASSAAGWSIRTSAA